MSATTSSNGSFASVLQQPMPLATRVFLDSLAKKIDERGDGISDNDLWEAQEALRGVSRSTIQRWLSVRVTTNPNSKSSTSLSIDNGSHQTHGDPSPNEVQGTSQNVNSSLPIVIPSKTTVAKGEDFHTKNPIPLSNRIWFQKLQEKNKRAQERESAVSPKELKLSSEAGKGSLEPKEPSSRHQLGSTRDQPISLTSSPGPRGKIRARKGTPYRRVSISRSATESESGSKSDATIRPTTKRISKASARRPQRPATNSIDSARPAVNSSLTNLNPSTSYRKGKWSKEITANGYHVAESGMQSFNPRPSPSKIPALGKKSPSAVVVRDAEKHRPRVFTTVDDSESASEYQNQSGSAAKGYELAESGMQSLSIRPLLSNYPASGTKSPSAVVVKDAATILATRKRIDKASARRPQRPATNSIDSARPAVNSSLTKKIPSTSNSKGKRFREVTSKGYQVAESGMQSFNPRPSLSKTPTLGTKSPSAAVVRDAEKHRPRVFTTIGNSESASQYENQSGSAAKGYELAESGMQSLSIRPLLSNYEASGTKSPSAVVVKDAATILATRKRIDKASARRPQGPAINSIESPRPAVKSSITKKSPSTSNSKGKRFKEVTSKGYQVAESGMQSFNPRPSLSKSPTLGTKSPSAAVVRDAEKHRPRVFTTIGNSESASQYENQSGSAAKGYELAESGMQPLNCNHRPLPSEIPSLGIKSPCAVVVRDTGKHRPHVINAIDDSESESEYQNDSESESESEFPWGSGSEPGTPVASGDSLDIDIDPVGEDNDLLMPDATVDPCDLWHQTSDGSHSKEQTAGEDDSTTKEIAQTLHGFGKEVVSDMILRVYRSTAKYFGKEKGVPARKFRPNPKQNVVEQLRVWNQRRGEQKQEAKNRVSRARRYTRQERTRRAQRKLAADLGPYWNIKAKPKV